MIVALLVACGNDEKNSSESNKTKDETEQAEKNDKYGGGKSSAEEQADWMKEQEEQEDSDSEQFDDETGEGYIEGIGKIKTVGIGYNDEVGIDGTDSPLKPIKMGSAELEIENLRILQINPDEDGKELYFDDREKLVAISVDMTARNTTDTDIDFHPNQSVIVTDKGEQVESDIMMMGEAGGDFLGKVEKEGQTWWLLDKENTDYENIKMIIPTPYSSDDWEDEAEEKRLEFEILTFEEALKRDGKK